MEKKSEDFISILESEITTLWDAAQRDFMKENTSEKETQISSKIAEIEKILEENNELSRTQKSTLLRLKGALYDTHADYAKEAEECLSKSVLLEELIYR